jgi:hypothetical protein
MKGRFGTWCRVGWAVGVVVSLAIILSGCGELWNPASPDAVDPASEAVWVEAGAYTATLLEAAAKGEDGSPGFVGGHLVVQMKSGKYTTAAINGLCSAEKVQLKGRINNLRLVLVTVPAGTDLAAEREKLAARSDVQSVTFDYVYELFEDAPQGAAPKAITNDQDYMWQWALDQIGFSRLPASVMPATAPTVAVVDTGVDYNHPDLMGKVTKGPDYVDGDLDPMDTTGHGTHVAGIIAATNNNNLGIAGVSGKSAILAIRVGTGSIPTFAAAAGIVYAADAVGVKVMNLSWGGSFENAIIKDAVAYAVGKGILVVASAGNSDTTSPKYPASYPEVLSVGATDLDWDTYPYDDVKAEFSSYGDTVDIAAPGVDILSTTPVAGSTFYSPSYDWSSGTSMAAPLVAGAAALVRGKWTTMTAQQVAALLIDNGYSPIGPDLDANEFGVNVTRLDVYEAFLAKLGTMPASLGVVWGMIIDANTGLPLGGATVTAKLNGGTSIYTATTRTDGTFTIINVPGGWYTVTASKSTYVATPLSYSRYSYPGQFSGFTYIPLPKVQAADVYTAVLAWSWNEELELDSYLWLPGTLPDRNKYMVGFSDRGNLNVHPFARFLRDEMGEAPYRAWWPFFAEAILFRTKHTGTYQFAVHDFSDLRTWGDDADVVVNLYKGAARLGQYKVNDATGSGDWWSVFSVTGPTGSPVAVQTLTDVFPASYGAEYFSISIEQKLALPTKVPAFRDIVPARFAP